MSVRDVPRAPFVLLGLMTVATVVGPIVISRAIRGGASPHWPPDRPVEWWTFGLITALVVVLMAICLGIGFVNWRKMPRYPNTPPRPEEPSQNSSSSAV